MHEQKYNSVNNFVAKKSLGQNFLHAPQVVSLMVHNAELKTGDTVLEVGPGKGVLTEKLLQTGARVVAVEKDDRAIPFLSDKFKKEIEKGQLELIHADILEYTPPFSNYTIVANIPYYISGEFLQKFFESDNQPKRIIVMLQKELAKRIVDEKGSILSMSVKAYGFPKYLTAVPRKFFRPMPNVDSAVLMIDKISKNFFKNAEIDEKSFFNIIKTGFSHKRKVLIKNLEGELTSENLKNLWVKENWSLTVRAEELKLDDWKKIVISASKLK
jgi:16S rRNA (adenine1518-N6/adenine1519-N6)-dimethyltransferase